MALLDASDQGGKKKKGEMPKKFVSLFLYFAYSIICIIRILQFLHFLDFMSNGLFFMLPEVPDLNLPYIPPKPEVFNLPEVPNLHDMSDEERGEFHRQIREMELRIEQLNQQNEDLRGKLREGQFKLFRQDIARAQARPEWQTWELQYPSDQ